MCITTVLPIYSNLLFINKQSSLDLSVHHWLYIMVTIYGCLLFQMEQEKKTETGSIMHKNPVENGCSVLN